MSYGRELTGYLRDRVRGREGHTEPDEWTDEVVGQVAEVIRDRAERWEALGIEAPPVYHLDAVFKLVLSRLMPDTAS